MSERQVRQSGGSLMISTRGRVDQTASRMDAPVNEKQMSERQRKTDSLSSTPRKKSNPLCGPYVIPHRRTADDDYIVEKSKQKLAKQSASTSHYKNSEYFKPSNKNQNYSDGPDSNPNFCRRPKNSSQSINDILDFKQNFKLVSNGTTNNNVEDKAGGQDVMVERVLKFADNHINVNFKENLNKLYWDRYRETLPPELVSRWKFNVTLMDDEEISNRNNEVSDSTNQTQTKTVPMLSLESLEKNFWVNIHMCKSVLKLWGMIMDASHLGQVEKLSNQMQSLYTHRDMPHQVIINDAYYAHFDGSWHRVKCLQYHGTMATVLFIDRGDEDRVSIEQLHVLDSQFCSLPAQAIRMSLAGLEIFADFDELQTLLTRHLYEKSMYVEVDAVTEDYAIVQMYVNNEKDETININELIIDEMLDNLLNPELHITPGNVVPAHVCSLENGIYIQLDIPSFKYFNLLMDKAEEQMTNKDYQCHIAIRPEVNKIYFVKNNEDQRWYRGIIRQFSNDNELQVFLIDFGLYAEVSRKNIVSLNKVCSILTKYPPQAIEVQLDQIPVPSPKILTSLENVVTKNKILHVEFVLVDKQYNTTTVILRKKTGDDFISINDALILSAETSSSKDNNIAQGQSRKHSDVSTSSVALVQPRKSIDVCSTKSFSTSSVELVQPRNSIDMCSTKSFSTSSVELVQPKKSIDACSTKSFSTSSVQSTKSSKNSTIVSEAGQKEVLKIDKERISKIRETHKTVQKNEIYVMITLSSVLAAPKVPEDNSYFDVHVVMSSDPSHFVVHLLRERTLSFNKMILKMSETCKAYKEPKLTSESIKLGQVYACRSSEKDNCSWCRAYVTEIREKMAKVYCCDYGSYKDVNISDMVPLEKKFCRLPYQAIWAELSGVKPTCKEWTLRACLKFQELTQSKDFVCRVISKKNLKLQALENLTKTPVTIETIYCLELIDTSSKDEDIDVANLLIQGGMADESKNRDRGR